MNTSTALYTSETILARHTTAAIIIRKCNDAGCVRIETRARHFIFFSFLIILNTHSQWIQVYSILRIRTLLV